MIQFIKNVLYGLFHFYSPFGRDSRQTFCDIVKGFVLLSLFGIFVCTWRSTLAAMSILDWFALNEQSCWLLCILFELVLLSGFVCSTVRRWQDLGIRIPKNDSLWELIHRARFWEVLSSEEGSREKNEYGDAPEENPVPLVNEYDLKNAITRRLFCDNGEEEETFKELKK